MTFCYFTLLCCMCWGSSIATSNDLPDLSSFVQPCEPFTCRPKRAPAPVKDFKFMVNGCGMPGLLSSSSKGLEKCCSWHDACYSICTMPKATCEKRLQRCLKATCQQQKDATQRDECFSTAKIFYIGANMIRCTTYQDAQKEACECVPTDNAALATRERLVYFLEENGAPEADLENEAIDALLEKYKGEEPVMFLRLLKKYPKALKNDPSKVNFMNDITKNVDATLDEKHKKEKKIKIEKEELYEDDEHDEL